jgi:hypothetical protein
MSVAFPVEHIPDDDDLYMRVHRTWFMPDGRLNLGCFKNQPDVEPGAMSTDWSRYATASDTQARARVPAANAVIAMNVGGVRSVPQQMVPHSPLPTNRAHTDVVGPKRTLPEARIQLGRIARLVIALPRV